MEKYDKTDPYSIEAYAKRLLNKSLRQYFGDLIELNFRGKGKLGQLLEEKFFEYEVNSTPEPDFHEAGVELKSTPMKYVGIARKGKKLVAKERLVLNIINYEEEADKIFKTSSFWKKNHLLLLMFYLWENKEQNVLDYIFKIIRLWRFPANDLRIIRDDWNKIHKKILEGKAHEISEGDTLFLGACQKGKDHTSLRKQPFSDIPAMQRAYSLKTVYMNTIINISLGLQQEPQIDENDIATILDEWDYNFVEESIFSSVKKSQGYESIIKDISQYHRKDETFEEYVESYFLEYRGKTEDEILNSLGIEKSNSKSKLALLTKAILGINPDNKIEEFEKAGVSIKTIRLTKTGMLKESMSFANVKFKEIVNEEWEDSYWYDVLNHKLFFVVFQERMDGQYELCTAFFWNMPYKDLIVAKEFWEDTKKKIENDDYTHFIKASDRKICHIRPKGKNSLDLMETPSGRMEKKKCFWLNKSYIKSIVDKHLFCRDFGGFTGDTVLMGFLPASTEKWVFEKGLYNLRIGNRRGAVSYGSDVVGARYAVFYRDGKIVSDLLRLDESGPAVWSKERLVRNGYPHTPRSDDYLLFHIVGKASVINCDGIMNLLSDENIHKIKLHLPFTLTLSEMNMK